MTVLTVSVAFDPAARAWVVRRAHTVVASYISRDQAIAGASEVAVVLRHRMHCDMRFRIKDEQRGEHEYLALNDHRSAAVLALRVLDKFRLRAARERDTAANHA